MHLSLDWMGWGLRLEANAGWLGCYNSCVVVGDMLIMEDDDVEEVISGAFGRVNLILFVVLNEELPE